MNKRLVGWILLCWLVGGLGFIFPKQMAVGWDIVRKIWDQSAPEWLDFGASRETFFRPHIIDGDTIRHQGQKIRLNGIDAPERGQPYGSAATRALASQLRRGRVTCRLEGEDRYGRHLGTCYVQGRNVNEWMVRNGYAWSYWLPRYRRQEKLARRERRGVHRSGAALRPEQWRRRRG